MGTGDKAVSPTTASKGMDFNVRGHYRTMSEGMQIIRITYDNGTYVGQYLMSDDGSPVEHGTGIFVWNNGDRYEGDFSSGIRTGHGTFVWTNGNRYDGEFMEDRREGLGTMRWTDGTVYDGDFIDGKLSGKGKLQWANGEMYVGRFEDDRMEGFGIHYSADGVVIYEGDWVQSCPVHRE